MRASSPVGDAPPCSLPVLRLRLLPVSPTLALHAAHCLPSPAELLPNSGLFIVVKTFLSSFAVVLANIQHAPLTMDSLLGSHIFESTPMLVHRLSMHYIQQGELLGTVRPAPPR